MPSLPRPVADPSRPATPERLLAAAEREFARAGYEAARLEDIAAEAGVQRASLLHHFGSKEALYSAIVGRSFAALGAALSGPTLEPGRFERRLERLVRAFAEFVDARPALARIILRELIEEAGPGRAILLEQVVPLLARVEGFVRREGRGRIRPRLPARAALLDTAGALLIRAASGDLRASLWGPSDRAWTMARALFLKGTSDSPMSRGHDAREARA